MREIRFRAWDRGRKRFHWGNGNLMLALNGTKFWQFAFNAPEIVNQDNYILMQYTGLKDKNGKPIYEGDIVKKTCYYSGIVTTEIIKYNNGSFRTKETIIVDSCRYFEVIGNIYENPELLKE